MFNFYLTEHMLNMVQLIQEQKIKQNFNFNHYIGKRSVRNCLMTQRGFQIKNVIIPNAQHNYVHNREKLQFQERKPNQYKLYISPNRQTKPLGLVHSKIVASNHKDKLFQPSFDNFDLSSMFSNKKLTPEEIHIFKIDNHALPSSFQTPQKKINNNHYNNQLHLTMTENTLKNSAQIKKSRPKSKGLRKLSQRAYEIVLNFRSVSYKQVANKLIDQLNSEKELDQLGKDQQNIKRRVYDALNVLIALGALRKQGRKIVGDRNIKIKYENRDNNVLKKQIQMKAQSLAEKKQQLSDLKRKYEVLKSLQNRNIIQNSSEATNNVDMPFIILNNKNNEDITSQPHLSTKACQKLMIKWLKSKEDFMNVDMQVLSQNFQIQKQKWKMELE